MAKQLNVDINFNANTEQAKKQIDTLKNSLDNISKQRIELFDDKTFKEANAAAIELKHHIEDAFNPETGKLDLSRFSKSLKDNGKTLDDYRNKLISAGSEGTTAFLNLSKAIAMSETPVIRLSDKLQKMANTLKNTLRWQISASVLTTLTGSLQTAYYYAKDLNESLNNIRIVTGYSANEMADFAKQANKAAKALSSTTTEYTDAALIFYQQGLSGQDVIDRTDVVIKMANVTGQSAQVVSDQMTAIWNNFDDGSKSMAYYADVITALGAATASSTDEISTGLEKFAAIAETVGLSYEYATAALATVTAETRQSADVVGTALILGA